MRIPRGRGWEWLARARSLAWICGLVAVAAVTVWSRIDGLAPSVIAVLAFATLAIVMIIAVAAKHLFASSAPRIRVHLPGSLSEEYVVESLKKAEEDRRRLEEETRKEREQRTATAKEFEELRLRYEERDAYSHKMEELFLGMTSNFDRVMVWYELAHKTLNEIDGALRAADLDGDRHWQRPNIGEGRPPISTEDAVRYAGALLYDYTKLRVAEIEQPPAAP